MAIAEIPSWMYEEREALRSQIDALESGRIRPGGGPRLATDSEVADALQHARQRFAEHEIMLAKFEESART